MDEHSFISIRDITKTFGSTPAVDGVSLDIKRGELFCLLGGSGCGKTTLLRMLAGLEAPDAGQIFIAGQDVTKIAPTHRPVNIMFQNYALFPHMSVGQNIAFGLVREGLQAATISERVTEMLALVRLEGFAHRRPHQLSGGQKQRVALARSLAKRPKVLLLDEPLAALDKKLRQETQYELMAIQETLSTTFVVVTHDQEEAMTLASRIGVMDNGRLIQVEQPKSLYEKPNSQFIAEFLGTITLVPGTLTTLNASSADVATTLGAITVHLDDENRERCFEQQSVMLALRPEKIRLADCPSDGDNSYCVTIEDLAFLGDRTHYRLRGDGDCLLKASQPNDHRFEDKFRSNDKVWAQFNPKDVMILLD